MIVAVSIICILVAVIVFQARTIREMREVIIENIETEREYEKGNLYSIQIPKHVPFEAILARLDILFPNSKTARLDDAYRSIVSDRITDDEEVYGVEVFTGEDTYVKIGYFFTKRSSDVWGEVGEDGLTRITFIGNHGVADIARDFAYRYNVKVYVTR